MGDHRLSETTRESVERLCLRYPDRHVGGPGNRAATEWFAQVMTDHDLTVDRFELDCVDWQHGDARVTADGEVFELHAGWYSPPCDVRAELVGAGSPDELAAVSAEGCVLLLHGSVVKEMLMPPSYPFFTVPEHARIRQMIEASHPAAVIAATGQNSDLAGSLYPFPLMADAEFELPSAYMKDVDGDRLLGHARETAEQVVARKRGRGNGRVVVCAHVDTAHGTPGALDNATGVAVLLALADLLASRTDGPDVELVPFNGEDQYAAPGQVRWLAENEGRLGDIRLAVNIDAAACKGQRTAVSLYGVPIPLGDDIRREIGSRERFFEGPQWPQSDHSIFVMNGRPAVAITSENFVELGSTITHTELDRPELADADTIVEIARFIADLIGSLR
jgi:aminopeptidase YwaD